MKLSIGPCGWLRTYLSATAQVVMCPVLVLSCGGVGRLGSRSRRRLSKSQPGYSPYAGRQWCVDFYAQRLRRWRCVCVLRRFVARRPGLLGPLDAGRCVSTAFGRGGRRFLLGTSFLQAGPMEGSPFLSAIWPQVCWIEFAAISRRSAFRFHSLWPWGRRFLLGTSCLQAGPLVGEPVSRRKFGWGHSPLGARRVRQSHPALDHN